MPNKFHTLAKDAGNRLRAYILTFASGATGVFFLALTRNDVAALTRNEKLAMIAAIVLFVITVVISLCELHIDARRFFYIAKQLERPVDQQNWAKNENYKYLRIKLMYGSYVTVLLATIATVVYLAMRLI